MVLVGTNYNSGANSTYVCQFRRSASDVCRIENNGTVYSSGNFNSASDIRLKTNIKTLSNSLEKVLQTQQLQVADLVEKNLMETFMGLLGIILL